ncbi:hypothetical protein E5358_01155 [Palleniella muris]|uniref:Uncharacterized protein n=1 Tax=Palleniella muris TaxID=3038145 RepID=A0AC61QUA1_9BACT|nr:hypothetical protein E5358_01155 [Palleniella muris]
MKSVVNRVNVGEFPNEKHAADNIIAHIEMLQGIICRMSDNSANCKTWTVTVISALIAINVNNGLYPCYDKLWICYIPALLFFFLDCYYLGVERRIRRAQTKFVRQGKNAHRECFLLKYEHGLLRDIKETFKAIFSFSTLPFYGVILIMIYCLINY